MVFLFFPRGNIPCLEGDAADEERHANLLGDAGDVKVRQLDVLGLRQTEGGDHICTKVKKYPYHYHDIMTKYEWSGVEWRRSAKGRGVSSKRRFQYGRKRVAGRGYVSRSWAERREKEFILILSDRDAFVRVQGHI